MVIFQYTESSVTVLFFHLNVNSFREISANFAFGNLWVVVKSYSNKNIYFFAASTEYDRKFQYIYRTD